MNSAPATARGRFRLAAALLLLLLFSAACGSAAPEQAAPGATNGLHGSGPSKAAAPPQAAPHLGAPLELLSAATPVAHQSSFVETDLIKVGSAFDAGLPKQACTAQGSFAELAPTGSGAGPASLAASAYCVYRFSAPGYDRGGLIRTLWAETPVAGTAWVGLANWNFNRWDWFALSNGRVLCDSLQPYFTGAGDLLLTMLVTRSGSGPLELQELRLGGFPPSLDLELSTQEGMPPLAVTLSASNVTAGEGNLEDLVFEWDVDGDGDYDFNTGSEPSLDYTYPVAGVFTPSVRVTNTAHEQAVASASAPLTVLDFWQHTFWLDGASSVELGQLIVTADDHFYAVGTIFGTSPHDMLVLKLNSVGQVIWARRLHAAQNQVVSDVGVDSDGNLLIAGNYAAEGESNNCAFWKWESDGDLAWAINLSNVKPDFFSALALRGPDIYVCGSSEPDSVSRVTLLAKLDAGGNLAWIKQAAIQQESSLKDLVVRNDFLTGDLEGFSAIGSTFDGATSNVIRVDYDVDGDASSAYQLGSPAVNKIGETLSYRPGIVPGTDRFLVTGKADVAGAKRAFALSMPFSGASVSGHITSASPAVLLVYTSVSIGSDLSLVAGLIDGSPARSCLLQLPGGAAGELKAESLVSTLESFREVHCSRPFHDGVLVGGGAQSLDLQWEPVAWTAETYAESWVADTVTSTDLNWEAANITVVVSDVTDALQIDPVNTEYSALLAYRPAL